MNKIFHWTYLLVVTLMFLYSCGSKESDNGDSGEDASKISRPFKPKKDSVVVEIFAEKFKWTVRYSGANNTLGESSYLLINDKNPLGVLTSVFLDDRVSEIEDSIQKLEKMLMNLTSDMAEMNRYEGNLSRMEKMYRRILLMKDTASEDLKQHDENAKDDIIVTSELHLKVDQEYFFRFRSKDVIHSAYFPNFRMQMNVVPGMTTTAKFTPNITTDSMRIIRDDPEFNYILVCNKICGTGHYNMVMKVIVDTPEEYNKWIKRQKPLGLGRD